MSTKRHIDKAYGHKPGEEAQAFYDSWANSYDAELGYNGYATPARCAAALAAASPDLSAAVLDLGCGTGLSGAALRSAGFSTIDGWDPSAEMLRRAEAGHCYRVLRQIDPLEELTAPTGSYAAVNAAGVMSPGLAPTEAFDQILAFLDGGGHICFSLNDHAIEDGAHLRRVEEIVEERRAAIVFKEYGEHLPGVGMKSWVYLLRKA